VAQAASAALAAASPALAAVAPLSGPLVAQWHVLLKAAAALPPAHSLCIALAVLYFTRGRSAPRKAPAPSLPLGPLSHAASRARSSYAELAALAEALRFTLVASAPAGAVVPPAQRKEAAAALAAITSDTEALLAARERAVAAREAAAAAAEARAAAQVAEARVPRR
jgi:hypothetical protein